MLMFYELEPRDCSLHHVLDLQNNIIDKGICSEDEELDYSIQNYKEEASDNSWVGDGSQNDISKSNPCISSGYFQDICRKTVKIVDPLDANSFGKGAPVLKKPKLTALKEKENEMKSEKVKVGIKETRNNKKILKTDKPAIENIVYCPSNEVENIFDKSNMKKTVVIENNLNTTSNFSKKYCVIDDKSFNLKLQNKSSEKLYKCDYCQKCFNHTEYFKSSSPFTHG